jgi:hypothetical protein
MTANEITNTAACVIIFSICSQMFVWVHQPAMAANITPTAAVALYRYNEILARYWRVVENE